PEGAVDHLVAEQPEFRREGHPEAHHADLRGPILPGRNEEPDAAAPAMRAAEAGGDGPVPPKSDATKQNTPGLGRAAQHSDRGARRGEPPAPEAGVEVGVEIWRSGRSLIAAAASRSRATPSRSAPAPRPSGRSAWFRSSTRACAR